MTELTTNLPRAHFALLLNGNMSTFTAIGPRATLWLKDHDRGLSYHGFDCLHDRTPQILRIAADAAAAGFVIGHIEVLERAGAITTKGRNAIGSGFSWPK